MTHDRLPDPKIQKNGPVAGGHRWCIPAIPRMMMDLMREWVVMNHPRRTHCPKVEVAQEHCLMEVVRLVEGPSTIERWLLMTPMMRTWMRTPKSPERKTW